LAEVTSIDISRKRVKFKNQTMQYDILVLAVGVSHDYFGNENWSKYATGLKTLDDALEIRQRILMAYEKAEWSTNPEELRKLLTFVVVGGGPTGVEMAGALSEIARQTLLKDFRNIDSSDARVVLIEGGSRLLPGFRLPIPENARKQLESIGVEIITNELVTNIDEEGVMLGQNRINAATVIWGAGVRASPLANSFDIPKDWMGRIIVEPDCSIPNHPEVFIIGDLANHQHAKEEKDSPPDKPLPGVAQTAIQMGNHVAKCITADRVGSVRPRFVYKDLGSMATIGRSKAVADIFGIKITGVLAWFIWLFVHLMSIVGFRNRLMVFIQWFWSYLSSQRGARLIRGKKSPESVL
jgi:NADH dehydrogenase